jgi:RND superfamily putative drug exporter
MFSLIAKIVERRAWVFLVGWGAFAALLMAVSPKLESVSRDDDVNFFPPGSPTVIGQKLLQRGFPNDVSSSQVVVIAERHGGKLTKGEKGDFAFIDRLSASLGALVNANDPDLGIRQVLDHRALVIGPRLVSTVNDGTGQATLVVVLLKGTYIAKQSRLAVERIVQAVEAARPNAPEGLTLGITGSAAVGRDMNRASIESMHNTTTATIALVVAILLIVYRSPLLALIPLVTIALSVWTSLMGIALLTRLPGLHFQVINITNIFVIVVLFGAGTDYCLFLIARYREELARGRSQVSALREAIEQVGGALVASAGTVVIGLGMLWFSSFAKIQYTGPAIALSLVIGLVASLTLAPVLLHWLRGAVFFPFKPPHHVSGHDVEEDMLEQSPMSGFWSWVATRVVDRPGTILVVSILALMPFAVFGARTKENYSQLSDLNPDQMSVRGARMVERYFPAGELAPATVLVEHPALNFRSEEGRAAVDKVSHQLTALSNVAEVRSVSQPLGKPADPKASFQQRMLDVTARPLADPRYVSVAPADPRDKDHITRIDVVFRSDPFSDEGMTTLDRVRQTVADAMRPDGPLAGATTIGAAGSTAMVDDLRDVTTRDQRRMYVLVTVGVYIILLFLIRRPFVCLYLIATVVFGYLASLGITDLVFRAMHTGPEPWGGLDWKVGFFLFVILVAIGEDYNIFLLARVLEEERKHGPIEGTRRAVAHTGGIISSCGLIMGGTLGSMLTGSLTALRELGFALGLGVLLDTFIVRPILVPAFVVLWHRTLDRMRGRMAAEPEVVEESPAPAP